jgi:hypothetical protein
MCPELLIDPSLIDLVKTDLKISDIHVPCKTADLSMVLKGQSALGLVVDI